MRFFKVTAGICFALVLWSGTASAQIEDRNKLVLELLRLMQFDRIIAASVDGMTKDITTAIRQREPNVPQEVIDIVVDVAREDTPVFMRAMFRDMMPLMGKYYSVDELRELIKFYKTPLGQKAIQIMPQMTADISNVMAQRLPPFAKAMQGRMLKRLADKGYKIQ